MLSSRADAAVFKAVSIDGSDLLRAGGPGAMVRSGVPALSLMSQAQVVIPKGVAVQAKNASAERNPNDKFDDEDYPAYDVGRRSTNPGNHPRVPAQPRRGETTHTSTLRRRTPPLLPLSAEDRSEGIRELVDHGTALDAACRIIILEDQLAEAHASNVELHRSLDDPHAPSGDDLQS